MSVSQNKKNEQQNNLCTTLTEQWKKGELEQGYYYTKYNPKVGKPFVEIELRSYLLDLAKVRDADTVEVLAPVPSYEEWQHQQMSLRMTIDDYKNVVDICEQLKELLKECGQKFFEAEGNYGFDDSIVDICSPMIDKITNAIGDI